MLTPSRFEQEGQLLETALLSTGRDGQLVQQVLATGRVCHGCSVTKNRRLGLDWGDVSPVRRSPSPVPPKQRKQRANQGLGHFLQQKHVTERTEQTPPKQAAGHSE